MLVLGAGDASARAGQDRGALAATNAARARLGLLPRKAPARARGTARDGRRVVPALAPTFLAEPGTLPAGPPPAPFERQPRLRLSARGVIVDVTLSVRFDR